MRTGTIAVGTKPVLDLSLAHFSTRVGNIGVIGTWLLDGENDPCLVLVDATKRMSRHTIIPCVIPLSEAWRWTVEMGEPAHVWSTISRWIWEGALPGTVTNKKDLMAVFDAVQSRLRDVISMPPMPAAMAAAHGKAARTLGELTLTDGSTGRVLHEAEVKADVRS